MKLFSIDALQQLRSEDLDIELLGTKGQSAWCESVWKKDKMAASTLIQLGENKNGSCTNKIPQN